jgi:putative ABC transport system permease protein
MTESLLRKLRHAARALRQSPGFSLAVVLTLALGIGANSAVFSAIDAILLRPFPFPHADRLVTLGQVNPKTPQGPFVAPVRLEDWNRLNRTFQAISGYYSQDDSELSGDLPEKVTRAFVAPRFLEVWGMQPLLGRDFNAAEWHFNGTPAVLISYRFWQRRFGGDPHVLGRTLRIGRGSLPIVGVMPASFLFPDRAVDLWSTSPPDFPIAQNRALTWFLATGRMRPGVSIEQARADLAAVQANLGREFPKTDAQLGVSVEPLQEATVGGVRRSLWLLFGSVSLLLLIACTNIAALLLARAAARRQEIAVRFSLGAPRRSVVAGLLAEVLLLALAGAGLGLAVAASASRVFRALAGGLPRVDEIRLDWRIVLYALGCALATTILCGLVPALRATSRRLAGSLAQTGRGNAARRSPVQMLLVGAQIAMAVTLLAGAGLLIRSFQALGRVSPGFDPSHVLTFHLSSTWAESGGPQTRQLTNRVLDGLGATPGVEAAAVSGDLPGVPSDYQIELQTTEGRAETEPKMLAQARAVTPSYFAALHIPLLGGELCRDVPGSPKAMVNRSFANSYLHGTDAIGMHVSQPGNLYLPTSEITGIVGDAREMGLDHEPVPTAYWCYTGIQPGSYFLVRTHGDPAAMASAVRRKLFEVEPRRSVYGLRPLPEQILAGYSENRLRTTLLAFFALTAVLLAGIGLYGTLSYLVNLRQREIGVRMAVGAARSNIVRQFMSEGLRVAAVGGIAGLAMAAAFTRVLAGMLFGVSPWDSVTLAAVVAGIGAVALAASFLPAVRAARLDPIDVLRGE